MASVKGPASNEAGSEASENSLKHFKNDFVEIH